MGFRQGAYARIWSVENKGKYSVCNMTVSKKNKETGEYNVEFHDGFVRLVGNAHQAMMGVDIPEKKGVPVKIGACDVTTNYVPERKQTYVNYVVYGFEDDNNTQQKSQPKKQAPQQSADDFMNIPDGADEEYELPFN